MIGRRRWWFVSLLAVLALVAAACGSDSSDEDSADTAEATADSDEESEAEDAEQSDRTQDDAPAGDAVEGGTLVIGSTQVPRTLNGLVQSGIATALPGAQLFASPLIFDADFNPQPYLAESWELADDGLSLTLNLVEGATFHDGMPITSEDVAFSVLAAQANHPFKTMFAPVTSVDTPDPQTAVINLSQPHPAILLAMSPPLLPVFPKHIYDDGQELPSHPRNTADVVGSGPFKLVDYDAATVTRLEANEDFFLGRPTLDEIIIQIFPDENTMVLSLEAGEIQMAALASSTNINRLQGTDGLVVTDQGHHGLGALNWLEFNTADEVLSDPQVRQAIAHAIDRDFITDSLHAGIFGAAPSPIAPSSPFFDSSIETYDLNLEKAAELLTAAGHEGGEGISLEIDYIPGPDEIQKNVAEYIVQALDEIGIDASLRASPDFPTWAERISTGEFDMTMNNVWNWGDPVIGVHRSYLSTNRVGVIFTNNTGYENAEVDAILDKAGQATDTTERTELYAEFQQIVGDELPIYWLNNTTFWQAYPDNLTNPPIGVWGTMSPMHELGFSE